MHPVLFTLPNGFSVHTYGVAIAVGTLCAVFIATRWGAKDGIHKDVFPDLGFWAIVGGVVGARLEYRRDDEEGEDRADSQHPGEDDGERPAAFHPGGDQPLEERVEGQGEKQGDNEDRQGGGEPTEAVPQAKSDQRAERSDEAERKGAVLVQWLPGGTKGRRRAVGQACPGVALVKGGRVRALKILVARQRMPPIPRHPRDFSPRGDGGRPSGSGVAESVDGLKVLGALLRVGHTQPRLGSKREDADLPLVEIAVDLEGGLADLVKGVDL